MALANNTLGLPGTYTQTLNDQTVANLVGGLRVPLFIGTANENLQLLDYEMIRGSSAVADNYMTNEDVSNQLTGTNRSFTVTHFPIVDGTGRGITAYDPKYVTVLIDGQPAGVSNLFGNIGEVVLSTIPREGAVVTISYYFKRTDTLISKDNLSIQADGTTVQFKTNFVPIVDGSNGGVATTDPNKVTVTVGGLAATVTAVDGQAGLITLSTAPAASATVLATYYTNTWQDTFDYLPVTGITNVIRVGTAPGRSDYTNTLDFVIQGNQIQWGNSFNIAAGTLIPNTTAFYSQINAYLRDNKAFMRPGFGIVDGTNKDFTLEYLPTDGTGKGEPTDDVSLLVAYVGTSVSDARANGTVEIEKVDGSGRKITLKHAPTVGQFVYVTYWYSMIADDTFTLTCITPSTPLTYGTYSIVDANGYNVLAVIDDRSSDAVADPNFAIEGITYPPEGFDGQTIPGYSVVESVLLNFFNHTDYWVLSSLGAEGSNGSGSLGQTYIDAKTGLRFTIMPGTTVTYNPGDLLEFDVTLNHNTSILPFYDIPGLKITINNINGVAPLNTGIVTTFNKSGLEPAVGDFYFISVDYAKTEYPIKVYTKIKDVVADMGAINTDNRLSLAASLAFTNGAIALALAQVLRGTDGVNATPEAYSDVLSTIESPIINSGVKPNFICALTTDPNVITSVRVHCEKMSTIRYKTERTGIYGYSVGTTPEQAQAFAINMMSERMVGLYPDGAVIGLIDELGNVQEAAVDGSFLAAGFTGLVSNPIYDVATPLTNKRITGFRRLLRVVDSVTMNQTVVAGVTCLEDLSPDFLVRQATTTNPSNVLTREPTVIYIKDYVQQQMRLALDPFIGVKFLPTVLQDVESTMDSLMNSLVNNQIITAFTGTSATQDPNDPTLLNCETFYSPVFPLLWILVTFGLRTSL